MQKSLSRNKDRRKHICLAILFVSILLLSILSFSFAWACRNYGNISFDEIVFHLNMPLQGTSEQFIRSYLLTALRPALFTAVEMSAALLIIRAAFQTFPKLKALWEKSGKIRNLAGFGMIFGWLLGLIIAAQVKTGFFNYFLNTICTSSFIENEYVAPAGVDIVFPEKKKNLICIFVESAETSAQDEASGGLLTDNCIPEMTKLAEKNVSFSQSERIEGAAVAPSCGWTMAGMVAETAGLPLKLYSGGSNIMSDYDYFMPGIVSIGDILQENGYKNIFMAGSDFVFGGRELYCKSHGDYEILDYKEAINEGIIPEDYYVWWGFEDSLLYRWAKEELVKLAESNQPFNFSMLTVDTHHENGYVCDLCDSEFDNQYANVWHCASRQLAEFVSWIREQYFYDDTVIVIIGDHCSMDTDFYAGPEYDVSKGETRRKVYNVFINADAEPVQENNRLFTTMDFFPSTLAAMGCKIEGEHLGLGVNLFSEEETLSEKYGYRKLYAELKKRSPFYNKTIMKGSDVR